MRILKVSLLNLNSLKGQHTVDFDSEPLASAGLFAITGPTGAGKSTLLDAITLALFGHAARYGDLANPADIMTRGTAESWAEVTFSVKGSTYVARWSRARAHGKLDGKIQNPKRFVSDARNNLIADSLTSAEETISELLGLDYERFMRSVMLAQGQFSRFLTSKANERAELLESLTGTKIYSRLGQLAYTEAQLREAGIKDRMERIERIAVLTDEQRAAQEADIAKAQADQAGVKSSLDAISKVRGRVEALLKAQAELEAQTSKLNELADEQRQNREDLLRLERHRKVAPHVDAILRHDAAIAALESQREAYQEAKDGHETAGDDLGQAIANFRKALADVAKFQQGEVTDAEKAKKVAEAQVRGLQKWIEDNKQDAALASKIGALGGAIKERDSTAEALEDAWSEWSGRAEGFYAKAAKGMPDDPAEISGAELGKVLQAYFATVEPILLKSKAELEEDRRELALKQEHLQKTVLLQSYEEQRAQLKDGEPCALCGSKHHPYAKGAHKFTPASQLEKDLKKAKAEYEEHQQQVSEATETFKQLGREADKLRKAHAAHLKAVAELATQFKKAGLKSEDDADVEALQDRANAYGEKQGELVEAQEEVKAQANAIKEAQRALANVAKEQERVAKVPNGVKVGAAERGEIDPDEAEEAYDDALESFRGEDANLTAITKAFKAAEAEMGLAQKQVEAAAGKAGFRSVKELKEARMDTKEVDRVEKAKGRIDTQIIAAQAKLDSAKATVADLVKEGVPQGAKAAGIQQEYEQLYAKNDELTTRIADARGALQRDTEAVAERKRLMREVGEEGRMVEAWRQLRELIGSADGSKFRKIAQGITLDLLIRHANRHMRKLGDRYTILREPVKVDAKGQKVDDELGLIVEDYYQANAQRPMASLSGGESFLASLALALGLSDLASRTVSIETLFIDEGFGTLDPDTLDAALTALEGLREGNKSVGIISHVEALKDRITTQIQVIKSSSGHSKIEVVPRV